MAEKSARESPLRCFLVDRLFVIGVCREMQPVRHDNRNVLYKNTDFNGKVK